MSFLLLTILTVLLTISTIPTSSAAALPWTQDPASKAELQGRQGGFPCLNCGGVDGFPTDTPVSTVPEVSLPWPPRDVAHHKPKDPCYVDRSDNSCQPSMICGFKDGGLCVRVQGVPPTEQIASVVERYEAESTLQERQGGFPCLNCAAVDGFPTASSASSRTIKAPLAGFITTLVNRAAAHVLPARDPKGKKSPCDPPCVGQQFCDVEGGYCYMDGAAFRNMAVGGFLSPLFTVLAMVASVPRVAAKIVLEGADLVGNTMQWEAGLMTLAAGMVVLVVGKRVVVGMSPWMIE